MLLNKLIYSEKHINQFITTIWLVSLVLVLLTTFTPLEFNPIQLTYLPRWGLWFLVIPATQWLWTSTRILPWLWKSIPWLLWVPLLALQLAYSIKSYIRYPTYNVFRNIRYTLLIFEDVFAAQLRTPYYFYTWHTNTIHYRWGSRIVAQQLLDTPWGGEPRRVIITPLLPGLQWSQPIADDLLLHAPWQPVDTASVK